ncbi:MAG: DNA helicase RecQ [Alphaproteobacteria bacterium]
MLDLVPDLSAEKRRVLRQVFGFDDFRPGQEPVIDALLDGRDTLAVMPTGAGKSLCFQVPALTLGGLTIVVSPLVALMQDQVAALRLAGVAAETINSGRDRGDNVASWRKVAAGETRLLYLSPERLMTEQMLRALAKLPVKLIAVDEAHCISQWGPAFRPEYEMLSSLRQHFAGVPISAFTATADAVTRDDIVAKLFGANPAVFVTGFDRPNIRLAVQPRQKSDRQVLAFLDQHRGASGIVYCLSRKKTDETAQLLVREGFRALPYHAGMDAAARNANQDLFLTEAGVIMVATIAFGMGIDKPDVRFVLHTDIPATLDAYYQEIGRAGRDGEAAEAVMLYGAGDIAMRRRFIEQEETDEAHKRRQHKRLDALIGYAEVAGCRRRVLLSYFGEDQAEDCGNCDNCITPAVLEDGTEIARLVAETARLTGQRFGAVHLIDILRGGQTEKVIERNHDELATYGAAADWRKPALRSVIRQMVAGELLRLDIQGHGGLSLTRAGEALLNGEREFRYRPDASVPKREKTAAAPLAELDEADQGLLDRLKRLRLKLARERGVPAYVVFPDKTLHDMAAKRPRDLVAFAEVNGVGARKQAEFGELFLAEIAAAG